MEQTVQKAPRCGADFRLGERQQGDRCHPAGQRISDHWHRGDVGGAGQEESARPVIAVDTFLDCQHQFWCALHFVNHSSLDPSDKTDGIGAGRAQCAGVIEGDVRSIRPGKLSCERRFPCLAWAYKQDNARIGERSLDERSDFSVNDVTRRC